MFPQPIAAKSGVCTFVRSGDLGQNDLAIYAGVGYIIEGDDALVGLPEAEFAAVNAAELNFSTRSRGELKDERLPCCLAR